MVRTAQADLFTFLRSTKAFVPGAQVQLCLQYGHAVKVS